jgi:hypothetical protein
VGLRRIHGGRHRRRGYDIIGQEFRMMDLAYLALTATLLAASWGLVRLCDKV